MSVSKLFSATSVFPAILHDLDRLVQLVAFNIRIVDELKGHFRLEDFGAAYVHDLVRQCGDRRVAIVIASGGRPNAIVLDKSEWWNKDGSEGESGNARLFLESLCAFLGIMPAPVRNALLRDGGVATPPTVLPPTIDPIHVAITAHRAAWSEFNSRCSDLDAADTPEAKAELDRLRHAGDFAIEKLVWAGQILPGRLFANLGRQVTLDEIAHVGERDKIHNGWNCQRAGQGA